MNRVRATQLVLALLLFLATFARADDVRSADNLLCTAVQVTQCFPDGECVISPPWELNVPQFIEVDLAQRTLRTTRASGQNRTSPIKNLERSGGLVVIQGFENGRAFSFVIVEESGMASMAVAAEDLAVSVFGACTPLSGPGSSPAR